MKIRYWIRRFALIFLVCLFLSILDLFLNLSELFFVQQIIDSALGKSVSNVFNYIAGMILVIFSGLLCSLLLKRLYGGFGAKVSYEIRGRIINNLVNLSPEKFEKLSKGEWLSLLNEDVALIVKFISSDILDMSLDVCIFIGGSIYLCLISVKLYVTTLAIYPIFLFLLNYYAEFERKNYRKSAGIISECSVYIQETITGLETIKSNNYEDKAIGKYKNEINNLHRVLRDSAKYFSLTQPIRIILRVMPFLISVLVGGYLTLKSEIKPSELLLYLFLYEYALNPLTNINSYMIVIKKLGVAFERLKILMSPEGNTKTQPEPVILEYSDPQYSIEFKHVSFQYRNCSNALSDINFKIQKGERVAFIGPSGCGKSTLLKLISGLYSTYEGSIFINGKSIKSLSANEVSEEISYVMQDSNLLTATIFENIWAGNFSKDKDAVLESSRKAKVYDFVESLSGGFETLVADNGSNLSGGQKQRISLARSLLKDYSILLLDETTSALDAENEESILETIQNIEKDKTIIMVAHNIYTIQNVEKVYVMENGKIVDCGTHDELVIKNSFYRCLCDKQAIIS